MSGSHPEHGSFPHAGGAWRLAFKRAWMVFATAITCLCLLLGGAAVVLETMEWNWARPYIETYLSGKLGRSVAIDGDLTLHIIPLPSLEVFALAVGGTDWAEDPDLATVRHLFVALAPWPLLKGRVEFRSLLIQGVNVHLVNVQDKKNWASPRRHHPSSQQSDASDMIGALPAIDSLRLEKAVVTYRNEVKKPLTFVINTLAGRLATPLDQSSLFLDGSSQGLPIRATLRPNSAGQGAKLTVTVPHGEVRISGSPTGFLSGRSDMAIALDSRSPAEDLKIFALHTAKLQPLSMEAKVLKGPGVWRIPEFKAGLGRSRLSGSLAFTPADKDHKRPHLAVDLNIERLSLADLSGVLPSGEPHPPGTAALGAKRPLQPTKPAALPALADVDVALQIRRFQAYPYVSGLLSGKLRARLRAERLQLDFAHVELKEGNRVTAQARLSGDLRAPWPRSAGQARIDLSGTDLASLLQTVDYQPPPGLPFHASTEVRWHWPSFDFANVQLAAGASEAKGQIQVVAGVKPWANIVLHSSILRYADLTAFTKRVPQSSTDHAQTPASKPAAAAWSLPEKPLPFAALQRFNGKVDLDVRSFVDPASRWHLSTLGVQAQLANGHLDIARLSANAASGHVALNGSVDASRPVPQVSLHMGVQNFRLGPPVAAAESGGKSSSTAFLQARIGGAAQVQTQGHSLHSLIDQANGEASLYSEQGHVKLLAIDILGGDVLNAINTLAEQNPQTSIDCFYAQLHLVNGVLVADQAALSTEASNIRYEGSIDLTRGQIDAFLSSTAQGFRISLPHPPIQLKGYLLHPKIRPNYKNIALRGAAAAALGLLVTPAAAVIPLIDVSLGHDSVCQTHAVDIAAAKAASTKLLDEHKGVLAH